MKKFNILFALYLFAITIFAEIPAGYYHKADGKKGSELIIALNDICSNGTFLRYGKGKGYTWEGFHYTDRNEDGSVIDMYSATVRHQTEFNSVEGMHIEHALPKSWWGALENFAFRDLHHLFPADSKTNITKSNLPLGEVETASFDNGVSKIGTTDLYNGKTKCFEPADEYKGDFARAYMYIATIYNEFSDLWDSPMMQNNTYPVWNDEALALLLDWHRNDPVSDKELKRQEAVYKIQHNRNPFIDYPELAEHIWGKLKNTNFYAEKDNRPTLLSPTAWIEILFPVTKIGTTASNTLFFEGINFTENLTLALQNKSKEINLSKNTISPDELAEGYSLTISVTSSTTQTIIDTLIINIADTIRIPLSITFSDEFMITRAEAINPIEAEIEWTTTTTASEYDITLSDNPDNRTADLMFSGYVEGSSYNKAIAIYNGTGNAVNLGNYSLCKQSNGTGEWKLNYPLSGTLANGECYVMVSSRADDELKAMADHIVSSPIDKDNLLNFNGNDAVALFHNNILIDIIGEKDNASDWGKDVTLQRKTNIVTPNSQFDWNEWTKFSKDDFSHLANHSVTLTSANILNSYTTTNNYIAIDDLKPNTKYFVSIAANNTTSVNILSFTTPNITTPEAYEATDIYANQFTANWEEVNYADGYVVELMQTIGSEEITVEENFNSVGSNGKPLPSGWSGNASGNYTSETSSGKSAPSIALKNTKEYIQTPTTPSPIKYIEFMYRFASKATGSYFLVYSVNSQGELSQIDKIEYINTTKTTKTYTDLENTYAIRIEYHKSAGNLAIDDVIYKYGGSSTNSIAEEYTTDNYWTFKNLTANTEYSYQVRALLGDDYLSEASNIISLRTTSTPITTDLEEPINSINSSLLTPHSSLIKIYTLSGIKIYETTTNTQLSTLNSQLKKGIYIAQIIDNNKIETIKFMIK